MLNNFFNQKHFKSSFNVSKYFNILSFNLKELKMTLFYLFQTDNFPHLKAFLFFSGQGRADVRHRGPAHGSVLQGGLQRPQVDRGPHPVRQVGR